jgi:hypothetical protein
VSEQPARYQRSTAGMAASLLVTVLVILAFVGFRSCTRADLEVRPQHVDYLSDVRFAQQAGARLVYPSTLPTGWYATNVDYVPGARATLGISMLTDAEEYVGVRQSPLAAPELLATYVDPDATSGEPVTLDRGIVRDWETWTDAGGDTALVGRWHGETLLVFGSASQAELETLAASLTADRAPAGKG